MPGTGRAAGPARTHAHPASLLGHRLIAVADHSEYWSKTMHDAFQATRDAGFMRNALDTMTRERTARRELP